MHEIEHQKKSGKIGSLIVVVAIVAGAFGLWYLWQNLPEQASEQEQVELKTSVDRGISEEDMPIFQTQIDDLKAQIAQKEAEGTQDLNLYLRLGNVYYATGELGLAVEQYDFILKDYPDDTPALENKGQALVEMGDIEGAEASWRKAISIGAQEHIYFNLAKLIRENYPERTDEIKTIVGGGIETLGQTHGLLVELGNWYWAEGMYDEAISHYQVAYQLSGQDPAIKRVIEVLQDERAKALEQEQRANQ